MPCRVVDPFSPSCVSTSPAGGPWCTSSAVYLGKWESPEAQEAYGKLIAKLAQGHAVAAARLNQRPSPLTVSQLLLKYVTEELPRYHPDEQHCQRGGIRILRQLFGEIPIHDFGPLKLRLVRDAMVAGGSKPSDRTAKPVRGNRGRGNTSTIRFGGCGGSSAGEYRWRSFRRRCSTL